ncbi:putative Bardet-Biedl syndrome 5 [Operophtera brumata]|uniref:Putative Bardet-Biedl syndrome 5 n=1 Tax=Operophtera brumata TaxID=104452 RepID=A0A0L7LUY1_OPEBR|nr:putative Bardet-Biedl syndrome 5 [Operophtera brumata]
MSNKNKFGAVWEDKEVLFDLPFSHLKLRPGEKIFERIEPIEDTKGNSGTKGRMVVTSLRIIWHSLASPRINFTKIVNSGLRGTTQALNVLAQYRTSRYEFIFTNLSPNCVRHYTSVVGIHKAYAGSRLYRDLKLRAALIHNKQLRMLRHEKICLNEQGIWNLSSDSGNLGTLLVTNVRVVWYADVNDAFNVSMPYITMESIAIRDSKFGQALVFVVRQSAGGYVLGFRADPVERLRPLLMELQALHQAYNERPIFGVEMYWDNELAQNKEEAEIQPVYSPYLGLAIEPLKEGFTLKSLFEVQSAT